MHAINLVELAGFISSQANQISDHPESFSHASAEKYWKASRCRLDRWGKTLKVLLEDIEGRNGKFTSWAAAEIIISEILASEVLTRTWVAVACRIDEVIGEDRFESVARSIHIGHLESRNRCLKIMMAGVEKNVGNIQNLDRLRRKVERWTDLMLAKIGTDVAIATGFDQNRVEEFIEEFDDCQPQLLEAKWELMSESLAESFAPYKRVSAVNEDLNEEIFTSFLECFPPEIFEATGAFKSIWMIRMNLMADNTEELLDELLECLEDASGAYLN